MNAHATPMTLDVGRIGDVVPRADGVPKVRGSFVFASDLVAPGMLWGRTVRSPHAHARVRKIDAAAALATPGVVTVMTARDLPGPASTERMPMLVPNAA